MTTEEELVKAQTAFQQHLKECSNGFYGKLAAKLTKENEQLKRQIADLKSQVSSQWV
jgi:cell division protein FtsB